MWFSKCTSSMMMNRYRANVPPCSTPPEISTRYVFLIGLGCLKQLCNRYDRSTGMSDACNIFSICCLGGWYQRLFKSQWMLSPQIDPLHCHSLWVSWELILGWRRTTTSLLQIRVRRHWRYLFSFVKSAFWQFLCCIKWGKSRITTSTCVSYGQVFDKCSAALGHNES